jgi:hypothetical protein
MVCCRLNAVGPVQAVATDVSTVPAETDQVYGVGGRGPHLVHIEMQSRRHSKLARRLWRYNALLDLKYNVRVRSIAVLLRPEADSRKSTGVLDLRLPDNRANGEVEWCRPGRSYFAWVESDSAASTKPPAPRSRPSMT